MRISDWSSDVCSSDLAGEGRAVEDRALVVRVLLQALDLFAFDRDRALVLVDAVTVEDANLDDGARHARRQAERGVAHVAGIFAEDRAQQLFFRRHRRFTLGGDLAGDDVARADLGPGIDDPGFVEVRSEERRVGYECGSTWRSRWWRS